jgi:hypothetical protein
MVLALLSAATGAPAQTNGYLLACSAAGPLGRGCTTLSDPADPAAMLANPAGLAFMDGRSLSLNGAAFLPQRGEPDDGREGQRLPAASSVLR